MNAIIDKETQDTRAKYNRNSRFYDLMEFPMEIFWYRKWRRSLFEKILPDQRVLEVGVGTGKNLPFYSDEANAFGIELSEGMFAKATKRIWQRQMKLTQADVQSLPFRDNTFDVVVATFVFCSVPDPVRGFREVLRVLKEDGQLLLLEHVLPKNATLAGLFNWFDKWLAKSTGVHINRWTAENIRMGGLKLVQEENLLASIYSFLKASPHLNGRD